MDDSSDIFWRIAAENELFASSGTGATNQSPFDPMNNARLTPGAFDPSGFSSNFVLPRFASGGPSGQFGFGPAVVEPDV